VNATDNTIELSWDDTSIVTVACSLRVAEEPLAGEERPNPWKQAIVRVWVEEGT